MQIQMHVKLAGFSPKKGSGTMENGQSWSHDHVELFCLTPLKESTGSKGFATSPYRIPNCDANKELASSLVGQDIVLNCEMITNGKGGKPEVVPVSFHSVKK